MQSREWKVNVWPSTQPDSQLFTLNSPLLIDRGGGRTHKFTRLSTWPLCRGLRTRSHVQFENGNRCRNSIIVSDDGASVGRTARWAAAKRNVNVAKARTAIQFQLQVPVSNRADRPYESQLGACPPAMTRGRFELPGPRGARRSERRVSASSTTRSQRVESGESRVESNDNAAHRMLLSFSTLHPQLSTLIDPCGIRTRVAGLRGRHPEPLEERAVFDC
jgi:hypothetical protein